MELNEILDAKIKVGDFNSIKDYFHNLLLTLWVEGEGFSGKRPFGDSGWEYDLYEALVKLEVVDGKFDNYDYLEDFDEKTANVLMVDLINECFK